MTAPAYGYLHSARVHSVDEATGGIFLTGVPLAPTSRWGPVPTCVIGLQPGDRVIAAALGTSRDALIVIAKRGDRMPDIGDIPGLTEALDELDDRLDAVEPTVAGHTTAIATNTAAIAANTTAIAGKVSTSAVGQPGGVGSLDGTGKQPSAEVNAGVQLTSAKNQPNGYAGLDAGSKLSGSQQVYATVAAIQPVGTANAAGSSDTAARGDHAHALPVTAHRTVLRVQREDNAVLATATSTTDVAVHTVALTGLVPNTLYNVAARVPSYSDVAGDEPRVRLRQTSISGTILDSSTPERQNAGALDVHGLLVSYDYLTGAAQTTATFVITGLRQTGTGTATFRAFTGMPYWFRVTQVAAALNAF